MPPPPLLSLLFLLLFLLADSESFTTNTAMLPLLTMQLHTKSQQAAAYVRMLLDVDTLQSHRMIPPSSAPSYIHHPLQVGAEGDGCKQVDEREVDVEVG